MRIIGILSSRPFKGSAFPYSGSTHSGKWLAAPLSMARRPSPVSISHRRTRKRICSASVFMVLVLDAVAMV